MPCAGCHDCFQAHSVRKAIQENGFRMDGDTTTWKTRSAFPFALRTTSYTTGIGPDSDASTVGILKPIAAASLGRTLSFWIEQPFDVTGDGIERRDLDYAWVGAYDVLRGVKPDLLSVRGGSFELELPFTQIRTHNLFAYDPYFLSGGFGGELAAPQRGSRFGPPGPGSLPIAVSDSVRRPRTTRARTSPTSTRGCRGLRRHPTRRGFLL
jgi:hypothetical protein